MNHKSSKISAILISSLVFYSLFLVSASAWTNPSQNPPLGAGVLYYSGGNVGIGTNAPIEKLEVSNAGTTRIRVNDTTDSVVTYLISQYGGGYVGTGSNTNFGIMANNDTKMTILSGGNVGIGTTSPAQKLSVAGIIESTSGGIKFPDGTTQTTAFSGGSQTIVAGNVSSGAFGSNTGGGNYSFPANVGIGTTSPATKLEVYKATHNYIKVSSGGVDQDAAFQSSDGTNTWFSGMIGSITQNAWTVYGGTGVGSKLVVTSSGNVGIGTTNPSNAKLEVIGTSGEIFRADANAGAYRIVANQSYVLLNGNVGIGTTGPTAKLEISGGDTYLQTTSIGQSGGQYQEIGYNIGFTGTNDAYTYRVTDTAASMRMAYDGFEFRVAPSGTAGNALTLTEIMRIKANGNVGIGTTSPAQKLSVAGIIESTSGGIKFPDGTTQTTAFSGGSQTMVAGNVSSGQFGSNTGGGNYSFPANVGIGTTSPGAKLDVASAATSWTTAPSIIFRDTAGTADSRIWRIGNVAVNYGDLNFTVGDDNTDEPNETVEVAMTINKSRNVGIGTTSPGGKLEIYDGSPTAGSLRIGNSSGALYSSGADFYTAGTLRGFVGWRNTGSAAPFNGAAGIYLFNTDNSNLIFGTNNQEKMRIDVNGNVGIGTTNPVTKLNVVGGRTYLQPTAEPYALGLSRSEIGNAYYIGVSNNNPPNLVFSNNAGTERVRIQDDGNVGIGTTSPTAKLEVAGTVKATSFEGPLTGTISSANVSSGNFGANTGGGNYSFPANVGIGTAGPGEKLHILTGSAYTPTTSLFGGGGNVLSQGAEPAFALSQDINSSGVQTGAETSLGGMGFIYINSSDYNNLRIGTQTNHKVIFRSNNLDRMTISNDGNVGIGTTSPGAKLDVAGNIKSSNHFVQGNLVSRPYATWSVGGASTGAVIIKLPGTVSNYGMLHIEINVYEYNGNNATTYICGGHNWNSSWYNYGCNTVGLANKKIRLAVKDGQYAIVIGEQGSVWEYGHVVLSKITTGGYYSGVMDLGGTYSIVQDNNPESYTWISGDLNKFNAGNAYFSGNVGIGTTGPEGKLTVDNGNMFIRSGGILYFRPTANDYDWNIQATGYNLRFGSASFGQTTMTMTNAGNVGIGTTSPTQKFHVVGSNYLTTFENTSTAANDYSQIGIKAGSASSYIWTANQNSTFWGGPNSLNIYAGTSGAMTLWTNALERVRIDTSGNVGIGTTDPTSKMSGTYGLAIYNANYPGLSWSNSNPRNWLLYKTGDDLRLYNNSDGEIAIFKAGGNVGIGTTSPGYKLTVDTNISDWATRTYNAANGSYFYAAHGSGYGAHINAGSNASSGTYALEVMSAGATRLYVRGDGNVGIGTASPNSKLSVGGSGSSSYAIYGGGTTYGVFGSGSSYGLYGSATSVGVYGAGNAIGVQGYGGNQGIYGESPSKGVEGRAYDLSGTNYGGYFYNSDPGGDGYSHYGVYGSSIADAGVYGVNNSGGVGVYGTSPNLGVYGVTAGTSGIGVQGTATGPTSSGVRGYGPSGGYDFDAIGPGVNYGATSSGRWKKNVIPINDALAKINSVSGVYFDWDKEHGGGHDVGFIGEDIAKIMPEITVADPDAPEYVTGMDYSKITPLLLEGIKELNTKVKNQEAEIKILKEKIELLGK